MNGITLNSRVAQKKCLYYFWVVIRFGKLAVVLIVTRIITVIWSILCLNVNYIPNLSNTSSTTVQFLFIEQLLVDGYPVARPDIRQYADSFLLIENSRDIWLSEDLQWYKCWTIVSLNRKIIQARTWLVWQLRVWSICRIKFPRYFPA